CIVGRDTITLALDQSRSQSDGVARAIPVNQYWAAYFYIEDIGSYREELLARGAEIFRGPEDAIYGCREVDIKDPDGHILCFAQDLNPSAEGPGLG
ncbi:MAG: VOC family protein, partial [Pseudomonadota bacterium]